MVQTGSDGGLRLLGMLIGGGAGALLLAIIGTYALDARWLLGLPGIGLALVSGAFSLRRDARWGVVAAFVGMAWTIFFAWLRQPSRTGLDELAIGLLLSPGGAIHLSLVAAAGLLAGAGWIKPQQTRGPSDRSQLKGMGLDELLEAWEQPISAPERDLLAHELKTRGYRWPRCRSHLRPALERTGRGLRRECVTTTTGSFGESCVPSTVRGGALDGEPGLDSEVGAAEGT